MKVSIVDKGTTVRVEHGKKITFFYAETILEAQRISEWIVDDLKNVIMPELDVTNSDIGIEGIRATKRNGKWVASAKLDGVTDEVIGTGKTIHEAIHNAVKNLL